METLSKKMGAAPTAPDAPVRSTGNSAIYPLPAEYHKPIRFQLDGITFRLKGGRALVLDRLIAAGPAGIDRAATLQWIANLADTIAALRNHGIAIETRRGWAANYALLSSVVRIGGDV